VQQQNSKFVADGASRVGDTIALLTILHMIWNRWQRRMPCKSQPHAAAALENNQGVHAYQDDAHAIALLRWHRKPSTRFLFMQHDFEYTMHLQDLGIDGNRTCRGALSALVSHIAENVRWNIPLRYLLL
jgi:hypothetical protein